MLTISRYLIGSATLVLLPCVLQAAPFAYIANTGSNNLSIIDTATNTVTGTVPLGERATGVAVNRAGTRVYATNGQHLFVIDTATNAVAATVTVGTDPNTITGVAVNPAGTRVYVANVGAQNVSIIDTATTTIVATLRTGDSPIGVAVNPAGTRVYVSNLFSHDVSVIDAATNTVVLNIAIAGPGPYPSPLGVVVNPAGTRVYVANQNGFDPLTGSVYISVIDATTNTVIAHVPSGGGGSVRGIAMSPDGGRVYVSNGAVIDTATNTMVATMPVNGYGIAVNPSGTRVYVPPVCCSPSVLVVDTTTNSVVATVNVGSSPFAFGQFIGPSNDDSRNYVQKAYVAYYGRPAEPGGQDYWASRMEAVGGSLDAIIGEFGNSPEFNRRYGGLSYTALVTKIYQQALERDPDPAGLAYYVSELQAGRRTLQSITLDVLNGAVTAPDSTVVSNKLDVAAYYTAKVAAGCPYGTEQDGVDVITVVTALPASVAEAKKAVDVGCGP